VRSRIAARGLDPRGNAILSYGGCGALFTGEIARAIGAPTVLVPELASVLSAFGAATADVRRERVRSLMAPMPIDPEAIAKVAAELRHEVERDLAADAIEPSDRTITLEADLRFKRQTWELSIPLATEAIDVRALAELVEDFGREYARRYGRGSIVLGAPIELVSLRAVGLGRTVQASLAGSGGYVGEARRVRARAISRRPIRVGRGRDGMCEVDVHLGAELVPGAFLDGPAVIDGRDTTIWVPRGASVEVDRHGTFVIRIGKTEE
jgi:N-methylhydantoinase A